MSAIMMARLNDRILTMADGAVYAPDGTIVGFASKMLPLPEFNAVIACQGPAFLLRYIGFMLTAKVRCFDTLLEALPAILRRAHDNTAQDLGDSMRSYYVLVGGYSPARERFESYYIRSFPQTPGHESFSLPGEAWALMPAPEICASPWPTGEAEKRFGLAMPPEGSEWQIDHFALGARLLAAMRFTPADGTYGSTVGASYVGGFIEAAALGVGSYSSEIIHRWPDRLNEPIEPEDGDPLPASVRYRPAFMLPA